MNNPKFEIAPNLDLAETNPNLSSGEAYIGTVSKGQSAAQPTVSSSEAMWGALAIAATAAGQGFALGNAYKVNEQNRNFAQQDIKIKELMIDKNKSPEQKRKEHTEILNSTTFYAAGNYEDWKTKSYSNNMDTWLGDHDLNRYTENLVDQATKKWTSENPGGEITPTISKQIYASVQASHPETKGSTYLQKNKLDLEQKEISKQRLIAENQTLIALNETHSSTNRTLVFTDMPEEEKNNLASSDPVFYSQLLRLNNDPNQSQTDYATAVIEETINALPPEQQKGLREASPEFQDSFQKIIREEADKRYKTFQKEYGISQAIGQAQHGELLLSLPPTGFREEKITEFVLANTANRKYLLRYIPSIVEKDIADAKEGADPLTVESNARTHLETLLNSKKSKSESNSVEIESEQLSVWDSLKSEPSLRNIPKEQYIEAIMNTLFNKEKAIKDQATLDKTRQETSKDSLQTVINGGQLDDSYSSDLSLRARLSVNSGITIQEDMRGKEKEEVLRLWSESAANTSVSVPKDDTEYLSISRQQNLLEAYKSNPKLTGDVIYEVIVRHFQDEDALAKSIYARNAQLDAKAVIDADTSQLVGRLYKDLVSSPEDIVTSHQFFFKGNDGNRLTEEQAKAKLYATVNTAADYESFLKALGIAPTENPSKIRDLDNTYIRFKAALKKSFSSLSAKEKRLQGSISAEVEETTLTAEGETVVQVPEHLFDPSSSTGVSTTTVVDPYRVKRGENSYLLYTEQLRNPADPEAKMAEVAYSNVRDRVSGGTDVSSTYTGQAVVYARNGGIWFNPGDSHSTIKDPKDLIYVNGTLTPEGVKRYSFINAQVVLALKADGNDDLLNSVFKYAKEEYNLLTAGGGFFQAVKDKPVHLIDFEAVLDALANDDNTKDLTLSEDQRKDLALWVTLSKTSNINDTSNPSSTATPLDISKNAAMHDGTTLNNVKSIISDITSTIVAPERQTGTTVRAALIHKKGDDPNITLADTRLLEVIGIDIYGNSDNAIKTITGLKEEDSKKLNDFKAFVAPYVPDGFPSIGDNSLVKLKLIDGRLKRWGLMTLQEQASLTLKAVLDSPIPNSNSGNEDRSERFNWMLKVLQKNDKIAAATVFALAANLENRQTEYVMDYQRYDPFAESNPDSEGDLPWASNTQSYYFPFFGKPDQQWGPWKGIKVAGDAMFGGLSDGDMDNQGRVVQEEYELKQRRKESNLLTIAIDENNGGKPVAGLPTSGPYTADSGNSESVDPYRGESKQLIAQGLEQLETGGEDDPHYTSAFIDEVGERSPPNNENIVKEVDDTEKATGTFLRPPSSASAKSLDTIFFSPSTAESKVAIDNMLEVLIIRMATIAQKSHPTYLYEGRMNNILNGSNGVFTKPLPSVEGIMANVNSNKLTSAIDANGSPQTEQINTNAFHLSVRVQETIDRLGDSVPKELIETLKHVPRAIALRLYDIDTEGTVHIHINAKSGGIPFDLSIKQEDMVQLVRANTKTKTEANKPGGNTTVLDVGKYNAETIQKMRQLVMNGKAAKDIQDIYLPRPVMSNP